MTFTLRQHRRYGDGFSHDHVNTCEGDASEELKVRVRRLRENGIPHVVDGMTVSFDDYDGAVVTLRYEAASVPPCPATP